MQNKKIGAYLLVGVLLVAGSNLHGSDGWFMQRGKTVMKKGKEFGLYLNDNKGEVTKGTLPYLFAAGLAAWTKWSDRSTNQSIDAIKASIGRINGIAEINELEARLKGIEAKQEPDAFIERFRLLAVGFLTKRDAGLQKQFEGVNGAITDIRNVTIRALQEKCVEYDKLKNTTIPAMKKQLSDFKTELRKKAGLEQHTKLEGAYSAFAKGQKKKNDVYDGMNVRLKAFEAKKLVTQASLKTFGEDKFATQAILEALTARVIQIEVWRDTPDEEEKKDEKTEV